MKIKKIDKEKIIFDNGNFIIFDNDLSDWEFSHGKEMDYKIALFEAIPLKVYNIDFNEDLKFKKIKNYGFKFGDDKTMIEVPCYNYSMEEPSYLSIEYYNGETSYKINEIVSSYKDIDPYAFKYCVEHLGIDENLNMYDQLFKYFEVRGEIIDRNKRLSIESPTLNIPFLDSNPFIYMFNDCGAITVASSFKTSEDEIVAAVKEAFNKEDSSLKNKIMKIINREDIKKEMDILNGKFINACVMNSLIDVKKYVELGADVHINNNFALKCAEAMGNNEIADYLKKL